METQGDHDADQVEQLVDGFGSLVAEYDTLAAQHRELENKLLWAKQQYLDLLRRSAPDTAAHDHRVFLNELEQARGFSSKPSSSDWLGALSQHEDGDRRTHAYKIRKAEIASAFFKETRTNGPSVKIWNGLSADRREPIRVVSRRPTASTTTTMEQDFTVPGTPSKLGCPFSRSKTRLTPSAAASQRTPHSSGSRLSAQALRSRDSSFIDPIQAEICGNDPVSPRTSIAASAQAVCPIRFLDQHSPEEVAQYFEKHKHELPTSHAACVQRFQSNDEQIRKLDAKYGNLVSMIQGLGHKHQPMLPEKPEDEEFLDEQKSKEKVKNWAKAVNGSIPLGDEVGETSGALEDERTPHFDRPLKEIRVGESPSRPWGIPVPARYERADSSEKSEATASPIDIGSPPNGVIGEKTRKCPFDHTKFAIPDGMPHGIPNGVNVEEKARQDAPTMTQTGPTFLPQPPAQASAQDNKSRTPQMLFTGPVFIGYSVEQAVQLLQQSGQMGKG